MCVRLVPGTHIRITHHQQDPHHSVQTQPHHNQLTPPLRRHATPFPNANPTSSTRDAGLAASPPTCLPFLWFHSPFWTPRGGAVPRARWWRRAWGGTAPRCRVAPQGSPAGPPGFSASPLLWGSWLEFSGKDGWYSLCSRLVMEPISPLRCCEIRITTFQPGRRDVLLSVFYGIQAIHCHKSNVH